MGHALNGAVQDTLVRRARMKGYEALWLPGVDHASIALQNVVERKIVREEGKTRWDLGREEFVERCRVFAEEARSQILGQYKRLGASAGRNPPRRPPPGPAGSGHGTTRRRPDGSERPAGPWGLPPSPIAAICSTVLTNGCASQHPGGFSSRRPSSPRASLAVAARCRAVTARHNAATGRP